MLILQHDNGWKKPKDVSEVVSVKTWDQRSEQTQGFIHNSRYQATPRAVNGAWIQNDCRGRGHTSGKQTTYMKAAPDPHGKTQERTEALK